MQNRIREKSYKGYIYIILGVLQLFLSLIKYLSYAEFGSTSLYEVIFYFIIGVLFILLGVTLFKRIRYIEFSNNSLIIKAPLSKPIIVDLNDNIAIENITKFNIPLILIKSQEKKYYLSNIYTVPLEEIYDELNKKTIHN